MGINGGQWGSVGVPGMNGVTAPRAAWAPSEHRRPPSAAPPQNPTCSRGGGLCGVGGGPRSGVTAWGGGKHRTPPPLPAPPPPRPGRAHPGVADLHHHFLERRRLLGLPLLLQRDFLAELPRVGSAGAGGGPRTGPWPGPRARRRHLPCSAAPPLRRAGRSGAGSPRAQSRRGAGGGRELRVPAFRAAPPRGVTGNGVRGVAREAPNCESRRAPRGCAAAPPAAGRSGAGRRAMGGGYPARNRAAPPPHPPVPPQEAESAVLCPPPAPRSNLSHSTVSPSHPRQTPPPAPPFPSSTTPLSGPVLSFIALSKTPPPLGWGGS